MKQSTGCDRKNNSESLLTIRPSNVTPIIVFYATAPINKWTTAKFKKKKLTTSDNNIAECHLT